LWLHLLAILDGNLPGEYGDPWDDRDLSGVNYRMGERDPPDI
jgi:hypothetical protein